MQLILVRHGIAEERRGDRGDGARELTPKGRRRFELAVRGLAATGLRLERILTSPLARARQTADLLAPLSRHAPEPCEELAAAPAEALLARLEGRRLAAVGHEPFVSQLCAWLVAGRRELAPSFPFKKGGVAVLEGEPKPGGMHLLAVLPPRVLRRLARGRRAREG